MEEDFFYEEGIGTTLRPKYKSAMKGSDQLERFLDQLEREILYVGWEYEIP